MRRKTIELFSGTGSFSKVAKQQGFETCTVDIDPSLAPDVVSDIQKISKLFSVASIGKNWKIQNMEPKTDKVKESLKLLDHTIFLISDCRPTYWFIENPRGMMRKIINPIFRKYELNPIRHTVTYCQYGDKRMKPTDIWTNCKEWQPKPPCKNGQPCHVPAPRGSNTGTQGLKGAKERGVIPPALFEEIFRSTGGKI
jgi:hypothetical protein